MARGGSRVYRVETKTIDRLSPHFLRVTFRAPELSRMRTGGPDQRIKLIFPHPQRGLEGFPSGEDWYEKWRLLPNDQRHPMRTYTVRALDEAAGELVVDFVAHGDEGPASRWVQAAAGGDEVLVIGPDGPPVGGWEWHPGAATTLLIAGDETAMPAIAGILESLPAGAQGVAFIEVSTAADVVELTVPAGVAVTWLPRADREYGHVLGDAVRGWTGAWVADHGGAHAGEEAMLNPGSEVLWEVPAGPDAPGLYAWLAGEAGAITGLRRHMVRDLGIDRSRIAFMGYWKKGRPEN